MARKNGKATGAWADVAAASEEQTAKDTPKRGRKPKGEQMRLKVDSRDAVRIPAKHELRREMTHEEWEEQGALLAQHGTRLMELEAEIATLKAKYAPEIKTLKKAIAKGHREVNAREWLTLTDCIEVHDVNTRTVTVYADVDGELGAEVIPARPMRPDEYERALKTSPFEPPDEVLTPPAESEDSP